MLVYSEEEALIDFTFLTNSFLRLINSKSENSTYVMDSLTRLIMRHKVHCIQSYAIRNPSHPFIEILRNSNPDRDNLGTLILKQIELIFASMELEDACALVKPFIIHVFLETGAYKHLIAKFLIRKLETKASQNKTLADLLCLYVTCLRNNEMGSYMFLEFLNEYIRLMSEQTNGSLLSRITLVDVTNFLIKIDKFKLSNG